MSLCDIIQFLLFMDDLMRMTEKDENIEENLRILDEMMTKWKMKISWEKTKLMLCKVEDVFAMCR